VNLPQNSQSCQTAVMGCNFWFWFIESKNVSSQFPILFSSFRCQIPTFPFLFSVIIFKFPIFRFLLSNPNFLLSIFGYNFQVSDFQVSAVKSQLSVFRLLGIKKLSQFGFLFQFQPIFSQRKFHRNFEEL
jgi:hypothetical protein